MANDELGRHCDGRQPRYLGSIPIARSTFRCLACPSVVLGRDSAYRPVPTVPTWLQPFLVIESADRPLGTARALGAAPIGPDPPVTTGSFGEINSKSSDSITSGRSDSAKYL